MFIQDGVLFKYGPQDITDGLLLIPENVHTIAKDCGINCFGLKVITVLEGVKLIEENAFANCEDLQLVVFTDACRAKVHNSAFNVNGEKVDMILHNSIEFFD